MKTLFLDLGRFNSKYNPDASFSWHNHGLGMLATVSDKVTKVKYAGLKYMSGWDELIEKVKGYNIIAISMMSSDYPQALYAIDIIKDANPKSKIIVGGIHATVDLESLTENEKIDYILCGEGEITFPKFLESPESFDRIIKGEAPDLDELPFLERSIYPEPLERNVDGWGKSPMLTILTARGCPFNCSFCQPAERNHFGKLRRRSVKKTIDEIKCNYLVYDPQFIVFYDDSFCYERNWVEEFINSYRLKIPFLASARADFICENPDLIHGLKKAGMKVISIGFESGSQRILDLANKRTTVEQNYEAARICGQAQIKIFANIMYGFPTETKDEQLETYKLCRYISQFDSMISPAYFTPFKGSKLGDECIDKGLSLIDRNSMTRFGRDKIKGVDYDFLDSFVWRN
jgi:radical SAM superfamily enzyme YgiQ (UPF0313 family)